MQNLAHKRQQILQQMEAISSMEYGSLQKESRPSKSNPDQPNGPYFKHQVWEHGKNATRRVPAEKAEALAEAIEGRQNFERLSQEFIDTTVAMTRENQQTSSVKKKRAEIQQAVQRETEGLIDRFLSLPAQKQNYGKFEAEFRQSLLEAGAQALQAATQALIDQIDSGFLPPPRLRFAGRRPLQIQGMVGLMRVQRDYYTDGLESFCPADQGLALEGSMTPGLARMICRAAAKDSYKDASADLFEYAGIHIPACQVQRTALRLAPAVGPWLQTITARPEPGLMYISADGTGAPMRKEFLEGRSGKQEDGTAKTREVKLGCVFLQTETDEKGRPVRKEDSTTYIGSFEPAVEFGILLRQEARRRGLTDKTQLIFISDGAPWLWELARINFPNALVILDFYHAMQHLHGLVEALFGKETPEGKSKTSLWKRWLLKDKAAQIVDAARGLSAAALDTGKALKEIAYLEKNLARMNYGSYRKAGYFIGSGVVEAGCKTVVGQRMKNSGMFWSEKGGQGVLDLRCALLSDRLDPFFTSRAAGQGEADSERKLAA